MEQLKLFEEEDYEEKFDENGVEKRVEFGEVWILGNHLLYCGDSQNIEKLKSVYKIYTHTVELQSYCH